MIMASIGSSCLKSAIIRPARGSKCGLRIFIHSDGIPHIPFSKSTSSNVAKRISLERTPASIAALVAFFVMMLPIEASKS